MPRFTDNLEKNLTLSPPISLLWITRVSSSWKKMARTWMKNMSEECHCRPFISCSVHVPFPGRLGVYKDPKIKLILYAYWWLSCFCRNQNYKTFFSLKQRTQTLMCPLHLYPRVIETKAECILHSKITRYWAPNITCELDYKEGWAPKNWCSLNCGVGEDSWESLGLQGDATSPS